MSQPSTFQLNSTQEGGNTVLSLSGRLMDQLAADHLTQAVDRSLQGTARSVILDLSALQYMNSTGLNILLNALNKARAKGGDAVLAAPSASVRQLLAATKLDSVFRIADSVAGAQAHLPV
jgi:anti-anti-sigma factor